MAMESPDRKKHLGHKEFVGIDSALFEGLLTLRKGAKEIGFRTERTWIESELCSHPESVTHSMPDLCHTNPRPPLNFICFIY